jgi:hypothetical protein
MSLILKGYPDLLRFPLWLNKWWLPCTRRFEEWHCLFGYLWSSECTNQKVLEHLQRLSQKVKCISTLYSHYCTKWRKQLISPSQSTLNLWRWRRSRKSANKLSTLVWCCLAPTQQKSAALWPLQFASSSRDWGLQMYKCLDCDTRFLHLPASLLAGQFL